jgi:hypothetical protein
VQPVRPARSGILFQMNSDANREGLRILRSDPVLLPVELLWRWSFGLGLLALLFFAYEQLRQVVLLSDTDLVVLHSKDPVAMAEAASMIVADAMPLLLKAFVPVVSLAAVLWIASAVLGRGVITRAIVRRLAVDYGLTVAADAPRWTSFAVLKFARVLMLLILVIGYLGGGWIAALVTGPNQDVAAAALILFVSLAASFVLWSYVNWVLSLAPLFLVRDGLSPLDSVVAAIGFVRRNFSRLRLVAVWNSMWRGVVAGGITCAGIATVMLRFALPLWGISALLVLETFVYLVASDFLLLARLAAYASIAVRELGFSEPVPAGFGSVVG